MTTSTGSDKKAGRKSLFQKLGAVVFWLLLWQLAAMALHQEILLASPVSVLFRLLELLPQGDFWRTVLFSFSRITLGFLLACVFGSLLGALAARFPWVRSLAAPLMSAARATPVASFIILALLWASPRFLSAVISFLMAAPIVYENVLEGAGNLDRKLSQMAQVFQIPLPRRLRFLYLPQILPYFRSACASALGLCWKAGAAAEVIGLPVGSIGERLYEAKIYLETPDLFAWTAVVVLISVLSGRAFLFLLDALRRRLEGL